MTVFIVLINFVTDKNIIYQTVNIGPDEEFISINDLFKKLSNKLKFNLEPKYFEDRPNEVKHATCSSDKAREILDYQTSVNLDQSLEKVINYIKSKGPKKFQYTYDLEIDNEKTPITWKEKLF
jgi:UDP-glucose 4-epimerase